MLSKNIYIVSLLASAATVLAGPVPAVRAPAVKARATQIPANDINCFTFGQTTCCSVWNDDGVLILDYCEAGILKE
jgi:hypothetical protein